MCNESSAQYHTAQSQVPRSIISSAQYHTARSQLKLGDFLKFIAKRSPMEELKWSGTGSQFALFGGDPWCTLL